MVIFSEVKQLTTADFRFTTAAITSVYFAIIA
jgi:hypothetical protein